MVVQLSAALVTAIYAANIPVKFAFRLRLDSEGAEVATGASAFEGRFALKSAAQRLGGIKPRHRWDSPQFALSKIPAAAKATKALKYALKHVTLEAMSVRGIVGLSDAMQTALLCGILTAAGNSVNAVTSGRIRIRVSPNFSRQIIALQSAGIVSVPAGHIILAAIFGALEYGNGRLSQWTHTRLKTS